MSFKQRVFVSRTGREESRGNSVTVLSYNVLAHELCGTGFEYCPLAALEWEHRRDLIIRELIDSNADVICLQEVERSTYDVFVDALAPIGYVASKYCRNRGPGEILGLLTLVRDSAVELIGEHQWCVRDLARSSSRAGRPPRREYTSPQRDVAVLGTLATAPPASLPVDSTDVSSVELPERSSLSSSVESKSGADGSSPTLRGTSGWSVTGLRAHRKLWDWLRDMHHVAQAVILRPRRQSPPGGCSMDSNAAEGIHTDSDANGVLIVANCHIYWNPRYPEIKVIQATLIVDALHDLRATLQRSAAGAATSAAVRQTAPSPGPGLILCGDFNSMPVIRKPTEHDTEVPPGGLVSGLYALLLDGFLPDDHPHHPRHRRSNLPLESVSPLHLPLRFQSAYVCATGQEPSWTNWHGHDFRETLDYVFVATEESTCDTGLSSEVETASLGVTLAASRSWHPVTGMRVEPWAALDVPPDDVVRGFEGGDAGGCPNAGMPSDHILVAVKANLVVGVRADASGSAPHQSVDL